MSILRNDVAWLAHKANMSIEMYCKRAILKKRIQLHWCENCHQPYKEHIAGQCCFQPSRFEPMDEITAKRIVGWMSDGAVLLELSRLDR